MLDSLRVLAWRTVAAAVVTTLSEFLGSAISRKQVPRTAAMPACRHSL